jgi:predicted MFS family arabinose efflux permease
MSGHAIFSSPSQPAGSLPVAGAHVRLTANGPTFRRSRAAVTATFATHAIVAGSIGPWIPALKANSGLDPAGLGVALTGYAAGLLAGTRLAGPALRRAGGSIVVRIGVPMLCAALAILPLANGLAALSFALAGLGLASGVLDVAMNTDAVTVERRFARPVMSSMHGTWSVSMLAGAALASGGVGLGIPIRPYLAAVGGLLAALSFPLLRWLPAPHETTGELRTAGVGDGSSRARRVVLLCLVAGAAFMTEGIAVEWSAVFLNEVVGTDLTTAAAGVVAFSAGMAAARFAGDRLSTRFDPSTVVRVGTAVGAAALAAGLAIGGAMGSIAALAILGLGVGPTIPLVFSAAGRLGVRSGRSALATVVTAGYVGSIIGPLVVGFTADLVGLRAAFAIPVVMCGATAIAAGAIRERAP